MSAPFNGCRDTQHPAWRLLIDRKVFSGDRLGGRSLHTTRSIAQIFVGLCSMSRLIYLILLCRHKFSISAANSLCGCCKWYLMLLAGCCEGFCSVRMYEALAAYVVRALSACWIREVSTQYLISIKCTSRLFGYVFLNFIARGYGLAAPSTLLWVALLALLADLI
jgi:hypothetical protein